MSNQRVVYVLSCLVLGTVSSSASALLPPVSPPANGYVTVSETATSLPSPPATLNHLMALGHVDTLVDPNGYFDNLTQGETGITLSMTYWGGITSQQPSIDLVQIACSENPASNICDCGCANGGSAITGSGLVSTPPTPGTANCADTSPAKTTPASSCFDGTYQREEKAWVQQPAGGQIFMLQFPDGSTLSQDPAQPLFYYSDNDGIQLTGGTNDFLFDGAPYFHAGLSAADRDVLLPPGGALICTSHARNFCAGSYEMDKASLHFPNRDFVQLNYYQPLNTSGVPDGYALISLDTEWFPGTPDAPGPMVWENAWSATTFYKANNVVSFKGVTYLALNDNENTQPDSTVLPLQWQAIGIFDPTVVDSFGGGTVGPQGPQGPAGAQGPQGAVGATGPQGDTGPQGAQGPAGAVGNTGPQGNAGAPGAQGPQGVAGPPGIIWTGNWSLTASYFLGDGVAWNGTSYVALGVNTGSEPSATNRDWMLLAAEGAQGPIGPSGPVGPAGATGATGAAGQNLVNLPGTITTVDASVGCPASAKLLGTSLIGYVSKNARGAETVGATTVVYCRY